MSVITDAGLMLDEFRIKFEQPHTSPVTIKIPQDWSSERKRAVCALLIYALEAAGHRPMRSFGSTEYFSHPTAHPKSDASAFLNSAMSDFGIVYHDDADIRQELSNSSLKQRIDVAALALIKPWKKLGDQKTETFIAKYDNYEQQRLKIEIDQLWEESGHTIGTLKVPEALYDKQKHTRELAINLIHILCTNYSDCHIDVEQEEDKVTQTITLSGQRAREIMTTLFGEIGITAQKDFVGSVLNNIGLTNEPATHLVITSQDPWYRSAVATQMMRETIRTDTGQKSRLQ